MGLPGCDLGGVGRSGILMSLGCIWTGDWRTVEGVTGLCASNCRAGALIGITTLVGLVGISRLALQTGLTSRLDGRFATVHIVTIVPWSALAWKQQGDCVSMGSNFTFGSTDAGIVTSWVICRLLLLSSTGRLKTSHVEGWLTGLHNSVVTRSWTLTVLDVEYVLLLVKADIGKLLLPPGMSWGFPCIICRVSLSSSSSTVARAGTFGRRCPCWSSWFDV